MIWASNLIHQLTFSWKQCICCELIRLEIPFHDHFIASCKMPSGICNLKTQLKEMYVFHWHIRAHPCKLIGRRNKCKIIYFNYLFRKYQNICFTIGLSLKMHVTLVNTLGNKPLPDMLLHSKNKQRHAQLTTPTISPSEWSGSNSLGGTFSQITTCPLAMARIAQPLHPSASLPGCPRSSPAPRCLQAVSSINTHLIYPSLTSAGTLIMGFSPGKGATLRKSTFAGLLINVSWCWRD